MADKEEQSTLALAHGASDLPRVTVDAYNAELKSGENFVGDRASKRAFSEVLDDWRERMRRLEEDPLGDTPTAEIGKKKLDKILSEGDPEAAGVIQGAIEDFAAELATVVRRFLRLKDWQRTERIVVGGGLRDSRIGELAIGRASVLLKADGIDVPLQPIRHHPDEAGLIGVVHLVPSWLFAGHDAILAVDIGGSNIRVGVVELDLKKHPGLSKASVWESELWRHAEDQPKRDEAVDRLIQMLKRLIDRAEKEKLTLAPFIGIGCPGVIGADGSIERGGQNLPGNWESSRFSLPERIAEGVGRIDDHAVTVLLHNDAVVQGLSELPFQQDVERWGVLTIGTGLGNARFTNKEPEKR